MFSVYLSVKWIRDNMLEQVEYVTSEGGNSDVSDTPSARLNYPRKTKYVRRQKYTSLLEIDSFPTAVCT